MDCKGHFAPITQVIRLVRGVCHGELDVKNIEESTHPDPDRFISKEMPKSDVCGNVSSVRAAATRDRRHRQCCHPETTAGNNFPNFALIWSPIEVFPLLPAKSLEF